MMTKDLHLMSIYITVCQFGLTFFSIKAALGMVMLGLSVSWFATLFST